MFNLSSVEQFNSPDFKIRSGLHLRSSTELQLNIDNTCRLRAVKHAWPIDPKVLVLGGDWSEYWYNGYSYARNAIDLFAAQSRIWVKNLTYRCATPMKQW